MFSQSVTPSDLAAQLAKSKDKRDRVVENANANHAAVRRRVIETGTARVEQIRALRVELDHEENAIVSVVNDA